MDKNEFKKMTGKEVFDKCLNLVEQGKMTLKQMSAICKKKMNVDKKKTNGTVDN